MEIIKQISLISMDQFVLHLRPNFHSKLRWSQIWKHWINSFIHTKTKQVTWSEIQNAWSQRFIPQVRP